MANAIVHRGPDDSGFHIDRNLGLGFRRLAIIDLAGGHQPMTNSDESAWVVFNGEIYNFASVREELEQRGHKFSTNSDTEVIVHGYKEWGDNVLDRLNGMFGLAIWDARRRRLMLARDRMGIKPLYYSIQGGRLLFGSEIRAILAALPGKPAVDPVAIESFLRYQYTPSPLTILEDVRKLPAGSRLIAEEGVPPRVERWWNFAPAPFDRMPSVEEAQDELSGIYARAVQRHLISDVPVGLLLSGGMDSALLLALMSSNRGSWKTYSVGYGETFADDELRNAAETAKILGSSNVPIELSCSDFEASIVKVVSAMEEPVQTSSIVPMYFVCQRAREDVTVALIGQGPDELFGGYIRHVGVHYGEYWRRVPKACRSLISPWLQLWRSNESLTRALYSLDVEDRLARYQQVFSILPEISLRRLFRQGVLPEGGDQIPALWSDLAPLMRDTDELGGLQFLEIRSSLPDQLLAYGDKMSMAHSLELRVPYLDQEVVEYVERLNASFKVRFGVRKWLHRRVAGQVLPNQILTRKKRGFATNVVDAWFRKSAARSMEGLFVDSQSLINRYLNPASVLTLLNEHRSGTADRHKVLFSLVILEHLLRKYDAFPPASRASFQGSGATLMPKAVNA
jgi:asparagine synthase (glutamine-hydrolysing)